MAMSPQPHPQGVVLMMVTKRATISSMVIDGDGADGDGADGDGADVTERFLRTRSDHAVTVGRSVTVRCVQPSLHVSPALYWSIVMMPLFFM